MNLQKYKTLARLTVFALGATIVIPAKTQAQESGGDTGAEVLTRGPVHEAFAGTVSFNPEAGIIVDREPPTLIEEVPPEQRLEGDNVVWIAGYWAWDEDQNDFIWISGIWRNLPPGREWVPGYWSEVDGGHQWTSGYWEDKETTEVSYLPEPPRSVEAGPSVEATSNDQTWIPGNWVYRDYRYAWRPGYWVTARPNWIWVPAYYRWTYRGYVYVDGYWDYPVASRGVVFAPVHFHRDYISRPGFYYSPVTVIALSVFTNHLFLRPRYCHYYFGDYYEPRYHDHGYYASYSYYSGRRGYDPLYAYSRWEHRDDRNWDRQRQEYYEYRRDRVEARPPRTWAALSTRPEVERERGDFAMAQRLDQLAAGKRGDSPQRFKAVDRQEREHFNSQKQEIRKFAKERQQLETTGGRPLAAGKDTPPARMKVDRSPLKSNKSDRSDRAGGPPARLQPRASELEKAITAGGRDDKRQPDGRVDSGKKGGRANLEDELRKKDIPQPGEETRTKPGQKRQAERIPERQGDPNKDRKGGPGDKREATPTPDRQVDLSKGRFPDPDQKRQAERTPERQGNPNKDRKAEPADKRQVAPAPDRQVDLSKGRFREPDQKRQTEPAPERQGNPNKDRRAGPDDKRQSAPAPERQVAPDRGRNVQPEKRQEAPSPRREVEPNRERKAAPAPTRQPEPERKVKPAENRESAAAPRPQPSREMVQRTERPKSRPQASEPAPRPQQQRVQQPAAQPQRTAARQPEKRPAASRETKSNESMDELQKKKR